MIKPRDPRELAIDLLPRSTCNVQVAAVIADRGGIFSWGWNSAGSGFGEHAEAAAIRRANKDRLDYAILYVASQRKRKAINSKPCEDCNNLLINWNLFKVFYRTASGRWESYVII